MSKISSNIKHLRQLKKWSQEQLANALDSSRAKIGSYEEERCDPPVETLIKISNLFHVSIDALVKCDLRTTETKLHLSPLVKTEFYSQLWLIKTTTIWWKWLQQKLRLVI
jgi:transcriptional regulator with XRE-family HTH domain